MTSEEEEKRQLTCWNLNIIVSQTPHISSYIVNLNGDNQQSCQNQLWTKVKVEQCNNNSKKQKK